MSAKKKLLDPFAGLLAAAAGVGSFFLIPGVVAAIPAALGIGAVVYGAKVAVSSLAGERSGAARPAVGAGSDATAAPRVRRGSPGDVWRNRGSKAIRSMQDLVAACQQPVIQGQLENVELEARDSIAVLDQLAQQTAAVERSLDTLPTTSSTDRDESIARLMDVRAGLLGRMERIVTGLERLQAEMSETAAAGVASTMPTDLDADGENHLRGLGDQLAGLRAGLEETRAYTAQVLGPNG